jgi:cytochrome c biogenesis protein
MENVKNTSLRNNVVWRFLSSIRLVVILMLVLVGLSLIGTFLIQIPTEMSSDTLARDWWMANIAEPKTGFWYPLLSFLGFFDIFHSFWFLGAGALLIVSILVCSINRWGRARANIAESTPVKDTDFYLTGSNHAEFSLSGFNNIRSIITRVLQKQRYTVREEQSGENYYFAGDRNRYAPLGTYLIHLSLVLFIIGFIIGSYFGFRDYYLVVAEGDTQEVGNGTGLAVHLDSFEDEYWPDGSPKDYRSEVGIYENNRLVKQGLVRVNHPISYRGIRFYQSSFGPVASIKIQDSQNNVLFDGNLALSETVTNEQYQRPAGGIRLSQSDYIVYAVGSAINTDDPDLTSGQIGIEIYRGSSTEPLAFARLDEGIPSTVENMEFTFNGYAQFASFQVARDPGKSLIWTASALFLTGLISVFYFTRRQVWIMMPEKSDKLFIRMSSNRQSGLSADIQRLEHELTRNLESGKTEETPN